MDTLATYGAVNLAWLWIQAVPLVVWPSFISSLLRPENQLASSVENYLARSLGIALVVLGLLLAVQSGAWPLVSDTKDNSPSPYAAAASLLSTLYHAATGFLCYARWVHTAQTAFLIACIMATVLAAGGLACLLFVDDRTRLSKKHGFDKDTSGYPFKNKESYRAKKKALS